MLKGLIVLNNLYKQTVFPVLSLFTSIGTLLCCALPALLVTLGMGAALAGFISVAPWITVFSKYKIFIFVGAGILLVLSSYFLWINRNAPCPIDPKQAKACKLLRKFSLYTIIISIVIYIIGFFFAFFAADLFYG
jgi:predicted membrane channel-forming protein YqfA (hemolysin III family)